MKRQRSHYSESELFVTDTHPLLWHLTEDESLIYTSFSYTFSHMPFLTFLPNDMAFSSVSLLSDAMASSNSSSAAVFLIASAAMFDQSIEACLRITMLRSSGSCNVTSAMISKMAAVDLIFSEFTFLWINEKRI